MIFWLIAGATVLGMLVWYLTGVLLALLVGPLLVRVCAKLGGLAITAREGGKIET